MDRVEQPASQRPMNPHHPSTIEADPQVIIRRIWRLVELRRLPWRWPKRRCPNSTQARSNRGALGATVDEVGSWSLTSCCNAGSFSLASPLTGLGSCSLRPFPFFDSLLCGCPFPQVCRGAPNGLWPGFFGIFFTSYPWGAFQS